MHYDSNDSSSAVWKQLEPYLDEAMASLGTEDRTMLALRYFENKTAPQVAIMLGIGEAATHKRTTRALDKLRKLFIKRGVTLSVTAIAAAVSANATQAAPVSLVKMISTVAATKGTAMGTSTKILVKGALKVMAWSKTKTVMTAGVFAVVTLTTATLAIRTLAQHHPKPPESLIESLEKSPGYAESKDAVAYLRELRLGGRLPGFQANEPALVMLPSGQTNAVEYPLTLEFQARKGNAAGPFPYHFLLLKDSKTSNWQLQKAWVDDAGGSKELPIN